MAQIHYLSLPKVLLLCLTLSLFTCLFHAFITEPHVQDGRNALTINISRRVLDQLQKQKQPSKKKDTLPNKDSIKLVTTSNSTKNHTNKAKSSSSSIKNKTNPIKPTSKNLSYSLNSTTKPSNSTKSIAFLIKKPSNLVTPKNKNTEANSKSPDKFQSTDTTIKPQKTQKLRQPNWIDEEEEDGDTEDGFVWEFRDLPSKFQETLLPDLERISTTSKVYLTKANKEITKGVKPIVGNKYAPTIAPILSFAIIFIPLIIGSLIFNHIKSYFSIRRVLIFTQVYLSIYFFTLFLSSLVTGLEPLRFFYATSQTAYICLQVLQTLGFFFYLVLLLIYLVVVFSTYAGLSSKLLCLGHSFVSFSVGLHYYINVFHRAVLHQPPRISWKVHAAYSTLFSVICLLGRIERRKKAYLEDGGEEGKMN